ncbi:hypothetical protein Syun_004781 [Stephania yunnanensis]|uniref:Uncharacterized protein n=1 Tax=Stephania yunnanensis TaxID=152371 RepID=A0AAP0L706_9MAGN
MAPFKALYGRPCRSPSCCAELEDREIVGPEIVVEHGKGQTNPSETQRST